MVKLSGEFNPFGWVSGKIVDNGPPWENLFECWICRRNGYDVVSLHLSRTRNHVFLEMVGSRLNTFIIPRKVES